MTSYAIPAPPQIAIPIVDSDQLFPVRRIFCVGRNYAAHVREMGGDEREPPFFFSKPADAIVLPGADVAYPSVTKDLHHEMELVIAIGQGGADVAVERALELIFGYAVGVDMTRRDLQTALRNKGQPWDAAKAFDQAAPISAVRRWSGPPPQGAIKLSVNGETRQDSVVSLLIWSIPEIIAQVSKLWRLEPGDLIFTGTPDGVAPMVRGDRIEGSVEGVGALAFTLV